MPDLSSLAASLGAGERQRIMLGRGDWREADWQDHCGFDWCEICDGEVVPPHSGPLDETGLALRAYLKGQSDD